jgi:hypothetical protein
MPGWSPDVPATLAAPLDDTKRANGREMTTQHVREAKVASKWLVVADDPSIAWGPFAERLENTENPRQQAMLRTFLEHSRAEADFDLNRTMATLIPEPQYFLWSGAGGDTGPKGYADVREMYARLYEAGGIGNLSGEYDQIVLDDHVIFFDSVLTSIVPWERAKAGGYEIDEETGHYAVRSRCAVVLSFDEAALLKGEKAYVSIDLSDCESVPENELSPGYKEWLKRYAVDGISSTGLAAHP